MWDIKLETTIVNYLIRTVTNKRADQARNFTIKSGGTKLLPFPLPPFHCCKREKVGVSIPPYPVGYAYAADIIVVTENTLYDDGPE
jgi:hypothetical protein